jgi:hypothetical protein
MEAEIMTEKLFYEIPRKPLDSGSGPVRMMIGTVTDVQERGDGMIKKSDVVRELVSQGNYKKALSITKGFRLGITREQNDKMVRAYECMIDDRFYRSIGVNIGQAIQDGVDVWVGMYGRPRV